MDNTKKLELTFLVEDIINEIASSPDSPQSELYTKIFDLRDEIESIETNLEESQTQDRNIRFDFDDR